MTEHEVIGVLLAFITAVLWGISGLLIKMGFAEVSTMVGTYITVAFSTILLLVLSIITFDLSSTDISFKSLFFLAAAGISQYVFGRTFAYSSIKSIGASRAYSITSSRILFSAYFGVVILKEQMSIILLLGTVFVFLGIFIIYLEGFTSLKGMSHAILGALGWGITPILIKLGLMSNIIFSNFISAFVALVAYTLIISFKIPRLNKEILVKSIKPIIIIILSSFGTFGAVLSYFFALSLSRVVVVVPISNLYPLITLVTSYLFIQNVEKISKKTTFGSIITISGAILAVISIT